MTRRLLAHWSKLMLTCTPCARSSHGLSAIAGKAYLFGGEAKARQAIDSVVHCLDVTKGWKTLEVGAGKVPPPRVGHAQCTMRNEVLMVFGGRTCEKMGEGNLNDLWSYNPLNNDWTQMEGHGSVPEPRSFHAATAIGDKLFVFGGCGAKGRLADLHQYDVKERRWSQLPSPPALPGRGGASLNASPDGRSLWVCAGFVGHETNDIMRFDLATSTWHRADSDFLRPRSVCASFTLAYPSNPAIFLFGGEVSPSDKGHEGAGAFARDLIALDPATGAPLPLSVESGAAPEARGWAAAAALSPTEAVLFGGLSGSDEAPLRLDDAWLLRIVTA